MRLNRQNDNRRVRRVQLVEIALATRASVAASMRSTSTLLIVFQHARVVFSTTKCFGTPSSVTMASSPHCGAQRSDRDQRGVGERTMGRCVGL